jgi:integrase
VRDVDFEAGTIAIRRRVMKAKGAPVVVDMTKNGRERIVAVAPGTLAVIREQVAAMEERLSFFVGVKLTTDSFLFSDDKGCLRPMDPHDVSMRWREVAREIGVTERLYDVRHGFVTAMLGAGYDLTSVSRRIGHARPSTTLDFYSGVVAGGDARLAEEADRLLSVSGTAAGLATSKVR